MSAIDSLQTEISVGSPEYAATEQTQGKPVFASDLYSLGVTCIYLLTQISPFDLFDIANNCWVWRQYLTTKISERLGKIIDKLIEKNTNRRFQSADEVMQAMGIYSSLPTPHSPTQWLLPTPSYHCIHTLTGLSSINSIAISPDGNILASGNDNKTINFWDLNSKKLLRSFTGHSQAVKSVAFSPDGKILATASDDKTIKLWNVDTFAEICTLLGHKSAVKSVAFSPNPPNPPYEGGLGGLLASGSWDKTVKLWDVNTAKEICTFTGHQLQVSAVAFSRDGKLLASASFDRTIRLWEIDAELQNRPYKTFTGHAWAVLSVAFSPDGKILATGSDDNTIKLWDVNTGQVIRTLTSHSWSVLALTLGADGETLISGSCDKTVKLHKVSTAEEITICGHVDAVSAVAFNPVAQLLVSGSRDKTIKLWQVQ